MSFFLRQVTANKQLVKDTLKQIFCSVNTCCLWLLIFFLVTLFRVGFFSSVAYLTVANLAQLGILVYC